MWFGRGGEAKQRSERAAALSRYAASPLAWAGAAMLLTEMVLGAGAIKGADPGSLMAAAIWVVIILAGLFVVACGLAWWWNTVALMRRTMRPSEVRLALVSVALPVTWVMCVAIGVVVMPWVVGLVWVMIDSLRG